MVLVRESFHAGGLAVVFARGQGESVLDVNDAGVLVLSMALDEDLKCGQGDDALLWSAGLAAGLIVRLRAGTPGLRAGAGDEELDGALDKRPAGSGSGLNVLGTFVEIGDVV